MRGRRGSGVRAGVALAICGLALLALMARPAASEAYVACSVGGGTLAISMTEDEDNARVVRRGTAIDVVVSNLEDFDGESGGIALACQGGAATVTATDLITFDESATARYSRGEVDLSGGPFAPGATPEADGTSEIEVRANMAGGRSLLQVTGTESDDTIDIGRSAAGAAGINLNGAFEPSPDVDIELNLVEIPMVDAEGGRDLIRGRSAPGFATPVGGLGFVVAGGGGRDRIYGGNALNAILGGDGRDRIFGGNFTDYVDGGDHRDLLVTGKGRDVPSGGPGHDRIRCGPGNDLYFREGGRRSRKKTSDKTKGCERIQRPRRVKVPRKIIRRFNAVVPALILLEDEFYASSASRSLSASAE